MLKNLPDKLTFDDFLLKITLLNLRQQEIGMLFSKKINFFSFDSSQKTTIFTCKNFFLDFCCRIENKKIVAISRENKKIDIFDSKKGFLLRSFNEQVGFCRSLSFSENGFDLISASNNGFVMSWDILSEKLLHSTQISDLSLSSIGYLPKNNQIYAVSGYDGFLKLIDSRFDRATGITFNHGCPIETFRFIVEEKMISVGGNVLRLWDFRQKKNEFSITENASVSQVHSRGDNVFYTGLNRNIETFSLKKHNVFSLFQFKKDVISFLPLSFGMAVGFSNEIIFVESLPFKRKMDQTKNSKRKQKQISFLLKKIFIPIKNKYNFKKKIYTNAVYSVIKNKKIFCFLLAAVKSLDDLDRNSQIHKIFGFFLKNKRIANGFVLFFNILYIKNNFKIGLNWIKIDYFFFLLNLFMKEKKIAQLFSIFWMFIEISMYFSVIWFFYFDSRLSKYIYILNCLLKKFVSFSNLQFFRELYAFVT